MLRAPPAAAARLAPPRRRAAASRGHPVTAAAAAPQPPACPPLPAGCVSVVLLAGGSGKRFGASMPKQYLPLAGVPIALHSLATFCALPEVGEVVVVCDPAYRDLFEAFVLSPPPDLLGFARTSAGGELGPPAAMPPLRFALPGAERQDSVQSGLAACAPGARLVAVHDSARPLVTRAEVRAVLADADASGAAVLGAPAKATIKLARTGWGPNGDAGPPPSAAATSPSADHAPYLFVERTLERDKLWEVHTPQVARPALFAAGFALVASRSLAVTDDVSVVEALGGAVRLTRGRYTNIKVTTPEDLEIAEKLLAEQRRAGGGGA